MTQSDNEEHMCKAERLIVAGVVAPALRAAPESVRKRRVARVDKDGNVVGYTTLAEVQEKVLLTRSIELAVDDGTRPILVMCRRCGMEFRPRKNGRVFVVCNSCSTPKCLGCGKVLTPSQNANRRKRCWGCYTEWRRDGRKRQHCVDCGVEHGIPAAKSNRCQDCHFKRIRAERAMCCVCNRKLSPDINTPAKVKKRGGEATKCRTCHLRGRSKKERPQAPPCACSECAKPMGVHTMRPSVVARRAGAAPRCKSCAAKARYATTHNNVVLA
jgi:hypothetical protein